MILLPSLDTRAWAQLVDEFRRELPRLDESWNEYNFSDPGIAAMELFAYVTETALFHSGRTTNAMQRSFLRLLSEEQRAPGVASTILAVTRAAAGAPIQVPQGAQVTSADGTLFETTEPATATAAEIAGLWAVAENGTAPERISVAPFLAFGAQPLSDASLLIGLTARLGTKGTPIRLYIHGEDYPEDATTRSALIAEWTAEKARCADDRCAPPRRPEPPHWTVHYSARVVWEYRAAGDRWLPLDDVVDETRALSLSGPVRFAAPPAAGPDAHAHSADDPDPALFFLRVRLVEGGYDRAPRLQDVQVNAVAVRHAAMRSEVDLGLANGWAGERFYLPETPVVADSVRLRLHRDGLDRFDWRATPSLDLSGPADSHLALNPVEGWLDSGDGRQGAPVPEGTRVFARFALGGGPSGNLAKGALTTFAETDHNASLGLDVVALNAEVAVTQRHEATGGTAGETIADAQARAIRRMETPDKAVTVPDFERLALETPGVPLARAWAVPGLHPLLPTVHAAGCVSVVLLPNQTGPAPSPSDALCLEVARYLEPRRLITTELHVIPPCYRHLFVEATLHVAPPALAEDAIAAASCALDALFHPITGGPDGQGWPPGRDVYAADVLALLEALAEVDGVSDVTLHAGHDPVRAYCDRVPICPNELIHAQPHRLTATTQPAATPQERPEDECC